MAEVRDAVKLDAVSGRTTDRPRRRPSGSPIRVESFEGPLDLLLHLCRTSEMDLARAPGAHDHRPVPGPPRVGALPGSRDRRRLHGHGGDPDLPQVQAPAARQPGRPDEALDEEGELLGRSWPSACASTRGSRRSAPGWPSARPSRRCSTAGHRRAAAARGHPARGPLACTCSSARCSGSSRSRSGSGRGEVEPNPLSVLERMSEILDAAAQHVVAPVLARWRAPSASARSGW